MQKISLHRAIAEIKNLEEKLLTPMAVVSVASNKDQMVGSMTKEKFESESQGNIDLFVANLERLRVLKTARNLANATVKMKVAGEEMTIDEAIVRKATASFMKQFITIVKQQMVHSTNLVAAASAEVEKKIEQQMIAIGGSTKKVSEDEVRTIRAMVERSTGKQLVLGKNVESFLKDAENKVENFLLEVDFSLSEINAQTLIEV